MIYSLSQRHVANHCPCNCRKFPISRPVLCVISSRPTRCFGAREYRAPPFGFHPSNHKKIVTSASGKTSVQHPEEQDAWLTPVVRMRYKDSGDFDLDADRRLIQVMESVSKSANKAVAMCYDFVMPVLGNMNGDSATSGKDDDAGGDEKENGDTK